MNGSRQRAAAIDIDLPKREPPPLRCTALFIGGFGGCAMRWIYRQYWLLRGWYESRRKDGGMGWYRKPVLYLDHGKEKQGLVVSDRCGRPTLGHRNGWHSTVILLEDGRVQFGGTFTDRVR